MISFINIVYFGPGLSNHPDFEIMKPRSVDVLGFLATWVAVGLLIGAFIWIIK